MTFHARNPAFIPVVVGVALALAGHCEIHSPAGRPGNSRLLLGVVGFPARRLPHFGMRRAFSIQSQRHSRQKLRDFRGGIMRGNRKRELIGKQYGRLTVLGIAPKEIWRNYNSHWICECECGQQRIINGSDLESGNVNSCGCIKKEKLSKRMIVHGNSSHPLYGIWQGIIARCTNPRMTNFNDYGGRGIRVCERWLNSFDAFVHDMGQRPSNEHSIDRINNDGDYSPENCRWANASQQALNKNRRVIKQVDFLFLETA